jgi:hypothetical protein
MHPAIRVRVMDADQEPNRRRPTFRRTLKRQDRGEAMAAGTMVGQ